MKIAFYLNKNKEFEDSLEKTYNMLQKFELEITKVNYFFIKISQELSIGLIYKIKINLIRKNKIQTKQ